MLQAEEAMRAAEIIAVGGGRLERSASEKITRRWRTAIGGEGGRRLTGTKADLGMLAALGVKVRN